MTNAETEVVICRACIAECTDFKALHKHGLILGEVTTLATLLTYCTSLDFPEDEEAQLPNHICSKCVQDLARSYVFKKKVLESNEVLRALHEEISSQKEKMDVEEEVEEDTKQFEEETEELQELATAAQLKRELENTDCPATDCGHYVSLTVLQEDSEESQPHEEIEVVNGPTDHPEDVVQQVHDDDNTEECEVIDMVVQDVAETTEIYHTEQYDVTGQVEVAEVGEEEENEEEEEEEEELEDGEEEAEEYEVTLHDIEEYEELTTDTQEESDNQENLELKISPDKSRLVEIKSNLQVSGKEVPAMKKVKTRNKSTTPKPPNPDLQCKECGKQLSNHNSFKYHMQLHSDHTPFLCSLCGEGFKTRNAYEGHIVIHDPNNPNTCELCGKSYRQASSLRIHMLKHTGEKPYQCDICGKGMTQKSGYKKHMLTHTGEKPHTCDICGRDFRYSSNLIAHKRCHSGEKPYTCPHCDKAFVTSEQMKRHTLVHTGERPFSCEMCGKNFKRRSSLKAHKHAHESLPETLERKVAKSNVVEIY